MQYRNTVVGRTDFILEKETHVDPQSATCTATVDTKNPMFCLIKFL